MRGDADERAALLTMPAGAVNEEVRAATEESIFFASREINVDNPRGALKLTERNEQVAEMRSHLARSSSITVPNS